MLWVITTDKIESYKNISWEAGPDFKVIYLQDM